MTYFYKIIVAMAIMTSSVYTFSQEKASRIALKPIVYNANVNVPFSAKEMAFLKEVYGESLSQEVLTRPQRVKTIKDLLRNRMSILEIYEPGKVKDAPWLSEVPLFDIYNNALKRDTSFSKDDFNPLKYRFHFDGFQNLAYRVDGTNYVILIKSQFNRSIVK